MDTKYQFTQKELKTKLKELGNWIKDFDGNELNKFLGEISKLKFTSPNKKDVFNAFKIGENNNIIQPNDVRILIIVQDPYPDKDDKRVKYGNRAHGLAFSFANSNGEIEPEPADDSLLNIFKAIKHYNKYETKSIDKWNTNLKTWASNNQILLLNAALTYKQEENHFSTWESFVTQIISNLIKYKLNNKSKLAIFLWGTLAQSKFLKVLNVCEIIEKNNNIPEELENIIDKRYRKNIKLKT